MYDKDGPLVAKSVYSQLCQQSEPTTRAITGFTRLIDRQINATLCRNKIAATSTAKYRDSDECVLQIALPMCSSSGYESRISSMIQDALQPMMEGLNSVDFKAKSLSFLPLAEIVDALARKLRQEGAPPERWATFVHVGI